MELLNSHPEISCEGELLNIDWKYIKNPILIKLLQFYPFPYLHYRASISNKPVYGFKLSLYQMMFPVYCIKLLHKNNWKIIYLKRENILDQTLSMILAKKTNYYHRKKTEDNPSYIVHIKKSELIYELRKRFYWRLTESKIIKHIECLKLIYEDDLSHKDQWNRTAGKIFKYLGIKPSPTESNLLKVDNRSYSERIENFQELIDFIQSTKYRTSINIKLPNVKKS